MKKAKDIKEVKAIEKKYTKQDTIDEFNTLCQNISSKLSKLPSIIRGILYSSFSGKNLRISYQGWEEEIDDAISRDYITDDLEADWDTTMMMRDLYTDLVALKRFIADNESDEIFRESYYEDYAAPLSLANRNFWEDAFELTISIS